MVSFMSTTLHGISQRRVAATKDCFKKQTKRAQGCVHYQKWKLTRQQKETAAPDGTVPARSRATPHQEQIAPTSKPGANRSQGILEARDRRRRKRPKGRQSNTKWESDQDPLQETLCFTEA